MTLKYQIFDGSSSATGKTLKQTALEPFSLPKVVVIKKLLRQNTYEKRKGFLRKSISHDAGVNVGPFSINENRLSSLRDFLELDLSQPTSSILLDSRVYTKIAEDVALGVTLVPEVFLQLMNKAE